MFYLIIVLIVYLIVDFYFFKKKKKNSKKLQKVLENLSTELISVKSNMLSSTRVSQSTLQSNLDVEKIEKIATATIYTKKSLGFYYDKNSNETHNYTEVECLLIDKQNKHSHKIDDFIENVSNENDYENPLPTNVFEFTAEKKNSSPQSQALES